MILRPRLEEKSSIQKTYSIHGHVKDSVTGEVLIGASVVIKELAAGVSSNVYGFYSITAPPGHYKLTVSFVGFRSWSKEISFSENKVIDIHLTPSSQELQEVAIIGEQADINNHVLEPGMHKLSMEAIHKIPALAGEVDILRALQLLPGIKNSSEASTNFSVRGGNLDQNMILLDEAPVYNPSHAIGIFSVFNPDAIKNVQLYKGAIPSEYGGRLSSVVDIRMKDGNDKKISVTGGIGTISSRLTVEGPIKKERSSFIVSGRYTYSDAITQSVKFMRENNFRFYFYDLNFKVNHIFNNRNKLFVSAYTSQDVSRLGFLSDIKWDNQTATIRWNHIFSDKLFSNTSLLFSTYHYNIRAGYISPFRWTSKIQDFTFKNDFTYFLDKSNTLRFGFASTHHEINPGKARGGNSNVDFTLPVSNALEHIFYLSHERHLSPKMLMEYGIRYTIFQNIGKGTIYHYDENHHLTDTTFHTGSGVYHTNNGLEPRLALRYTLNETSSVKASYSRTLQYLQLLSNSSFGLSPFDTWFPSGVNLKPQKADQVSVGYFKNLRDHALEISGELYYKWLYNQVDFANHAQLLNNPALEGELRFGKGYAYGLELYVRKNTGRLTGWLSYTYSRSKKLIPEISSDAFRANYDQPHCITLVGSFNISKRLVLSGNWMFATGRPTTLPIESFGYKDYQVPVYAGRNSIRLPEYHRLDLSLTINSKEKPGRKFDHYWVFSVYNTYARRNPMLVFTSPPFADFTSTTGNDAYAISILPFIPSFTYNFKF